MNILINLNRFNKKKSMKLFYKSVFLFLMITSLGVNGCKPPELKIISIELCENFNSEGICREPLQKSTYI